MADDNILQLLDKIDRLIGVTIKFSIVYENDPKNEHYHLSFNSPRINDEMQLVYEPLTICFSTRAEVLHFLTGYMAGYGRARSIF